MAKPLPPAVFISETIDTFIEKWCGDYAPHLLDSDENDGERLREALLAYLDEYVEAVIGEDGQATGWTRPNGNPLIDLTQSYFNQLRNEQHNRHNLMMKGKRDE